MGKKGTSSKIVKAKSKKKEEQVERKTKNKPEKI